MTKPRCGKAFGPRCAARSAARRRKGSKCGLGSIRVGRILSGCFRSICAISERRRSPGAFRRIGRDISADVWFGCAYDRGRPHRQRLRVSLEGRIRNDVAASLCSTTVAPNMLLYWCVTSSGGSGGPRHCHFGRCSPGSGTRTVQAAVVLDVTCPCGVIARGGPTGGDSFARRPCVRVGPRVWRQLPLPIANLLGPRVVRLIP